ncbi:MAG TPA: polysaccharide biosynthesis/export family protein [Nannocystaceae bacterium]|nr:polysaccharide biosynthesis/export family protein [Nannocystaceae bacterium]
MSANRSNGTSADVMSAAQRSNEVRHARTSRCGTRIVAALALFATALSGCAADKFRYTRMDAESHGFEARDLDDIIADATTPAEVGVEQVVYDFDAEKDEYRIGKNDVLDIFVMSHPELSSKRADLGQPTGITVRKDGKVHLPVVGAVPAEGLTLTEFETNLRTAVARFIVDPQVSVEIMRYESQKFFVLGQVGKPGTFPVDGDTTLLEAVTLAGGTTPIADLEGATVVRKGELLPINLGDLIRRGDTTRNVFMRAGDVVFVPDNTDRKVYVLGEVLTPKVVPMAPRGMTLAEALASAGGPTPARARREIAVIRGGFAKPVVYTIDLQKALLVDEQIRLRPGDRIVIAPTGLSSASRYMQLVLPFLQGAQAIGLAAQGGASVSQRAAAAAAAAAN